MSEYVYDDAFEHRLERVLREIGNEAVQPFDPYETTQIAISRSRIGMVPITQIPMEQLRAQQVQHPYAPPTQQPYAPPAQQPAAPPYYPPLAPPNVPPPGPPPGYYDDEPLPVEPRRWPLLAALLVLIAALVFAGFATGFIKLPSNFGLTLGSPAPTQTSSPSVTSSPTVAPTPGKTRKPRRTPRPQQTEAPVVTTQPQPTDQPTAEPTDEATPEPPETTPEPPDPEPTHDAEATPL
jgi:hypothetical protein